MGDNIKRGLGIGLCILTLLLFSCQKKTVLNNYVYSNSDVKVSALGDTVVPGQDARVLLEYMLELGMFGEYNSEHTGPTQEDAEQQNDRQAKEEMDRRLASFDTAVLYKRYREEGYKMLVGYVAYHGVRQDGKEIGYGIIRFKF